MNDSEELYNSSTPGLDAGATADGSPSMEMYPTLTLLYLTIFIIGIIGNSLVILVIIKDRKMRSVANFFLVSLSAADLMIVLFSLPVAVYELYFDNWIFGSVLCKLQAALQYLSVNASVLTMLAISFERLCVICVPLKARSYCTKRRTTFIIVGVWIVCALSSVPACFVAVEIPYTDAGGQNITICINNTSGYEWYIFFEVIVFYVCPGCLLFVIYSLIIKSLRNCSVTTNVAGASGASFCGVKSLDSRKISRKRESRQQLIFMLGAVVITYFICLLPFHVIVVVAMVSPSTFQSFTVLQYTILLSTARVLFFINSCINPILYNAISGKFRAAFVRLFRVRSKNRKDMCRSLENSDYRSYRTGSSTRRSVVSEVYSNNDDDNCSAALLNDQINTVLAATNNANHHHLGDSDGQEFL